MAEWISITEAARLTGYHPESIRELIREGRIKGQKFATVWQVDRVSLAGYIRKQEKRGKKRGPKKQG